MADIKQDAKEMKVYADDFVSAMQAHSEAKWDFGTFTINGHPVRFMDVETDAAFLGYVAARKQQEGRVVPLIPNPAIDGGYEVSHETLEAFSKDFKSLVQRYLPEYDQKLAAMLQDRISVFSPFIWADKEK